MFAKILDLLGLQKKNTDRYFIWNHERRMWWKPHSDGYTEHIWLAGIYTHEEAHRIATNANEYALHNYGYLSTSPEESLVRYEQKRN